MPGWNLGVLVSLVLASMLTTGNARAQQPVVGVDGCASLAMLVFTEVTEAGFRFGRELGGLAYSGPDEITICNQTARTVTAAFASSLRQMNIYVAWGYHSGSSGDYCQSHFLSQCYPDRDPYMPQPGAAERAFIAISWDAIFGAVSRTMTTAPGADVSRFDRAGLSRSIKNRFARYGSAGELADTGILH